MISPVLHMISKVLIKTVHSSLHSSLLTHFPAHFNLACATNQPCTFLNVKSHVQLTWDGMARDPASSLSTLMIISWGRSELWEGKTEEIEENKGSYVTAQNSHCEWNRIWRTACLNASHQPNFYSLPLVSASQPCWKGEGTAGGALKPQTLAWCRCGPSRPAGYQMNGAKSVTLGTMLKERTVQLSPPWIPGAQNCN